MPGSPIIPCLRYADAPAAIEFLCQAFGFEKHAVYADPQDAATVHHAQLVLGEGMIMLGSVQPGTAADLYRWKTVREAGGITACIYMLVADVEAHARRAQDKGASILRYPHDNEGYPGRGYDALDLEGNVWSFGNYDPWAAS
jgi:uncharacterized glyoxalase superfamily protein PhnB